MRQIPLAIGVDAARTFEAFLPGANALPLAHLRGLAPNAAPVYLWGGSGSGKTHLLQALVHRYAEQGALAGWVSARDPAPWPFDEAWALIVIDGCDTLDFFRPQDGSRANRHVVADVMDEAFDHDQRIG